jgi:hypothetical protein
MAKKLKYYEKFVLNSNFAVQIDPEGLESLKNSIKNNEIALSLSYEMGDETHGVSAYADQFEEGSFKVEMISQTEALVGINGVYYRELESKWEQDLINSWKGIENCRALSCGICDIDGVSHYTDEKASDIEIGVVTMVEK